MKRYAFLFLTLISLACSIYAAEPRTMVLVTGAENKFEPLNSKELKRIYLGLPVSRNGVEITALRNHSDNLLHEVFLQHIIFMSSRNYERQLATKTLRSGQKRLSEFSSQKDLINAIHLEKNGVSYLWEDDALKQSDLIIIQRLWTGSAE